MPVTDYYESILVSFPNYGGSETMTGIGPSHGWLRGTLELAVSAVLAEDDLHGYGLIQRIAEAGLGTVRGSVLYPALGRMENKGLIEAQWTAGQGGPGRKVYRLTEAGHSRLRGEAAGWALFASSMSALLTRVEGTKK
jgi:PadR family transcriptional regulator PadR